MVFDLNIFNKNTIMYEYNPIYSLYTIYYTRFSNRLKRASKCIAHVRLSCLISDSTSNIISPTYAQNRFWRAQTYRAHSLRKITLNRPYLSSDSLLPSTRLRCKVSVRFFILNAFRKIYWSCPLYVKLLH